MAYNLTKFKSIILLQVSCLIGNNDLFFMVEHPALK